MEKVFVTGTAGFIGFHLTKLLLAEGFRVHEMCRPLGQMRICYNLLQGINLKQISEKGSVSL